MTKKEQIKEAIVKTGSTNVNDVVAHLAENNIQMRLGYVKRIIRKYFNNVSENVELNEVEIKPTGQSATISKFYNPKFKPFIFDEELDY